MWAAGRRRKRAARRADEARRDTGVANERRNSDESGSAVPAARASPRIQGRRGGRLPRPGGGDAGRRPDRRAGRPPRRSTTSSSGCASAATTSGRSTCTSTGSSGSSPSWRSAAARLRRARRATWAAPDRLRRAARRAAGAAPARHAAAADADGARSTAMPPPDVRPAAWCGPPPRWPAARCRPADAAAAARCRPADAAACRRRRCGPLPAPPMRPDVRRRRCGHVGSADGHGRAAGGPAGYRRPSRLRRLRRPGRHGRADMTAEIRMPDRDRAWSGGPSCRRSRPPMADPRVRSADGRPAAGGGSPSASCSGSTRCAALPAAPVRQRLRPDPGQPALRRDPRRAVRPRPACRSTRSSWTRASSAWCPAATSRPRSTQALRRGPRHRPAADADADGRTRARSPRGGRALVRVGAVRRAGRVRSAGRCGAARSRRSRSAAGAPAMPISQMSSTLPSWLPQSHQPAAPGS